LKIPGLKTTVSFLSFLVKNDRFLSPRVHRGRFDFEVGRLTTNKWTGQTRSEATMEHHAFMPNWDCDGAQLM
jgi:hypothetical protein